MLNPLQDLFDPKFIEVIQYLICFLINKLPGKYTLKAEW